MTKLSILIPARNEEFLQQTVDDIFQHAEGDIEVLVGFDGWLPLYSFIPSENKRLKFIQTLESLEKSIGQRAMTNDLARRATGDYLMKLDAHCSLSQGFDTELLKLKDEATVIVPALCNLYAYDWVCEKGHKKPNEQFEDYKKCEQCGSENLRKEIVWQPISRPVMTNYYFDTNLHFQYCEEQDDEHFETETMSIQGSCFMISKKDYWDLNICDEKFGSWGQQGVEISNKAWLSGGRVISTRRAFYAHWFRGRKPTLTEDILKTQQYSKDLFLKNKLPGQIHPIQWLIRKFGLPGDWTEKKIEELCFPWYNK